MRSRHAAAPSGIDSGRLERRHAQGSAAEQALALYRAIFVKSTEAIAIIDPQGYYLEQNAAHAAMLGYSDDELKDQTPAIHLGDGQFDAIAEELATCGTSRRECQSRAKDGRERIIELSAFAVRDARGEPLCYVGIKRDITDEKRAAAELRESEERYRRLVEHSPAAVIVHSAGAVVFVNPAAMKLLGASDPAQILGRPVLDLVHADYREIVTERVRQLSAGARSLPTIEEKFVRLDGRPIDVEVSTIEFNFQGKPAIQIVANDITERRHLEQGQRLLADAGSLLNTSLDYQETLRSITKLAVPAVADWCLVDLVDDEDGFTRIAASSADPADATLERRLLRVYAPRLTRRAGSRIRRAPDAPSSDVDDEFEIDVVTGPECRSRGGGTH